jgi:hypothetical protein
LRIGFFTCYGLVNFELQIMYNFVILKDKKEIIFCLGEFIGYASTKVFDALGSNEEYILKHFSKFGFKFSFLEEPLMDLNQSLCGQVHN